MKMDKITVADLFEKQRRYLVPLFQRGFVWTHVIKIKGARVSSVFPLRLRFES